MKLAVGGGALAGAALSARLVKVGEVVPRRLGLGFRVRVRVRVRV